MLSRAQKLISKNSIQLMRYNNYSFRRLLPENKRQVLHLMANQFSTREPLTQEIYKAQPRKRRYAYLNQHQIWSASFNQCLQDNLSVTIVDEQRNGQIIGVTLSKNYFNKINQSQTKKSTEQSVLPVWDAMVDKLLKDLKTEHKTILQQQNIFQIWGSVIKSGHNGKGLLRKMFYICCQLSKFQSFQYAIAFTTNFRSCKSFTSQNFTMINDINCRNFEFEGKRYFERIEQQNQRPSLWLKRLQ